MLYALKLVVKHYVLADTLSSQVLLVHIVENRALGGISLLID
jgi:hypothetical protein